MASKRRYFKVHTGESPWRTRRLSRDNRAKSSSGGSSNPRRDDNGSQTANTAAKDRRLLVFGFVECRHRTKTRERSREPGIAKAGTAIYIASRRERAPWPP